MVSFPYENMLERGFSFLMESILILILKCLLLGIIWAALLIPVIFNRGGFGSNTSLPY